MAMSLAHDPTLPVVEKDLEEGKDIDQTPQVSVDSALDPSLASIQQPLSTFERVFTTHAPILESLLLQSPTDTILKLSHTSQYLRSFLRSYPTAWKYLSFRLFYPSGTPPPLRIVLPGASDPIVSRQSRPYAIDQLLMNVVIPFSPCLKSLELDNTAVSGQILISTVLHSRRETLEHLSVRGCKNVSLKYHIIPYLMMFGLQYDVSMEKNIGSSPSTKHLALKSLYTYRCRHHRRRPYLSSSLTRKDSDSEPTHELVNLCHKLGIWTDTAWCSTPAGRCFRRRGYVSMRAPQGSVEVWVVFDRLWRSKNWLGPVEPGSTSRLSQKDGKLWEHGETGCFGEALGTGEKKDLGEGKMTSSHLRLSYRQFVENIRCDNCCEEISERCEQCSILMHCVGCRKTLCASCAYDRPYLHGRPKLTTTTPPTAAALFGALPPGPFWWAPGAATSPCLMYDPVENPLDDMSLHPTATVTYPCLSFHWCCTEPIFSGGGGISIGTPNRDVDQVRAAPLPRGQGWEDLEYSAQEWSKSFPKYAYGDPRKPDYTLETGHIAMMRWLLGPPDRQPAACPRNLCKECYDTPQWKVHCKSCSKPLCIEHDLRGLRLRICGYRDLTLEKMAIQNKSASGSSSAAPDYVPYRNAAGSGFELPYRTQRLIDSTTSSLTEDQPIDGPAEVNHHPQPLPSSVIAAAGSAAGVPPPIPGRSRSISVSNSNRSRSSSPSLSCDSPADHPPKWQGCQSFFCPQYRAVGDQRQRCASILRECSSCAVYVCQDCVTTHPPCKCSYCGSNYLCPNCAKLRERDGTCRRADEEKAQREQKFQRDMQMLEGILETKLANEVAEFAGQFFDFVDSSSLSPRGSREPGSGPGPDDAAVEEVENVNVSHPPDPSHLSPPSPHQVDDHESLELLLQQTLRDEDDE
ncbi:hypothetical protein P175DRAFT_0235836 [Aspergillus ochraceoroseus IBT 24754]|uniref:Uncharacterized protein n=2 Tax=Aspergillus ochraceoroseus TaxID=138278 RepID=A0A2T5LX63_9EURO|nr:uncharacterized protein P175DRAFT_0235836 [Aspergillus ochraceoroseus IBT 24754]KKK16956.1 hypothetical protein AOCH_006259 [Aspergillus ochraceoroseus]PTU20874.1 hypothetical protein P175DRAFT_0235836 [Aspergillus ochraceoroseus IBT 24754]